MLVRKLCVTFLLVSMSAACGKKQDEISVPCTNDELWDQVDEVCVPRVRMDVEDMSPDDETDAEADMGSDDAGDEPDQDDNENNISPECDADHDGVASIECGGMDCDDGDGLRSPNIPEFCDHIDNDCDDINNEGLDCSFYAHSGDTLYAVDPFALTVTELGTDLPNLQDIDTHPSGALLGVTFDGLFQYDDLRDYWFLVGEWQNNQGPSDPNGMAIDSGGRTFVTSESEVFEIDILDGSATRLGLLGQDNTGEDYYSSGDCVVNKRDSLFMTSKHDPETDWLLLVDRNNGTAQEVGPIGFTRVFGLTSAWGTLYGLTDSGSLIEIDSMTGEGTLIHQFQGTRFFGAASTPLR